MHIMENNHYFSLSASDHKISSNLHVLKISRLV